MATDLKAALDFPASSHNVFSMFSATTYLEAKCAEYSDASFEVVNDKGVQTVTIYRGLDGIPDSYARFLGSELKIREQQIWSHESENTYRAEFNIKVIDKPVDLTGTFLLEQVGQSSSLTIEAKVAVSIPIFGGMAESFIRDQFQEVLADEHSIGLRWLADHQ
jgi:hypothetical protein